MASTRRFPGAVHSPIAVAPASRPTRAVVTGCIALVTALAWAYLVYLDRQMLPAVGGDTMMARMGMAMERPRGAGDAFFTFVMWAVMMIGMMAGAALPVLLLFAGIHARRGERRTAPAVLSFGLGYLTVWLGFSAFAAMAQWALHQGASLSPAMATRSTLAGGVILIAAGAYQLTPLKRGCLAHCRSPLGFLMSSWRDGASGAFLMGLRHGGFCLGCCWALMGVLFVVGVMNLVWVGVLTAFILAEKLGPAGARVARAGGVVLIACGVMLLSA